MGGGARPAWSGERAAMNGAGPAALPSIIAGVYPMTGGRPRARRMELTWPACQPSCHVALWMRSSLSDANPPVLSARDVVRSASGSFSYLWPRPAHCSPRWPHRAEPRRPTSPGRTSCRSQRRSLPPAGPRPPTTGPRAIHPARPAACRRAAIQEGTQETGDNASGENFCPYRHAADTQTRRSQAAHRGCGWESCRLGE